MNTERSSSMTSMDQQSIIDELKKRVALSRFTIYVLVTISCYSILIELEDHNLILKQYPHTYFSSAIVSLISIFALLMIHKLQIPMQKFRLTLKNLKQIIIESIAWTLLICVLLLLLK